MTPYSLRRQKVLQQIGVDGIAVLFAATEHTRSGDTTFPFRQNSDFHYLSGFPEPEAVLVLDGATQTSTLYCRRKDPLYEIWEGFRYGAEAACAAFGFDAAHDTDTWQSHLETALQDKRRLYALWGQCPEHDTALLHCWHGVQQKAGQRLFGGNHCAPDMLADLAAILNPMRLLKDSHEQALLKQAGQISAQAHIRAMQAARPGMNELQIEAELTHEFMRHGARFPAYASIVAGGKNACCLHYTANRDMLQNGELLLIDAGAEYQFYAGDITRTFPVNGQFSPAQKDLYEVVLAANEAGIAAVKPGADWADLHQITLRILVRGLIDFKLLQGSVDGNIESLAYQRYYMHGLGHWIGLDVHDVGGRWHNGQAVLLQAGMCTTIEPGLYIPADSDIPAAFRHTGIRIEDNILVTGDGHENYTAAAPKTVTDIEAIMREARCSSAF